MVCRKKIAFCALALALMPGAASALEGSWEHRHEQEGSWKQYAAFDYFFAGKAYNQEKADLPNLYGGTYPTNISLQTEFKKSNAMGGRLGFWYIVNPIRKHGLGASLGYAKGPVGEYAIQGTGNTGGADPWASTLTQTRKFEASFFRFLLEGREDIGFFDNFSLRLCAGAGFAAGRRKDTYNKTLVTVGGPPDAPFAPNAVVATETATTYSKSFSGFTWEMSPSVMYSFSLVDVEFGMRYAVLPKMDKTANLQSFQYSPIVLFFGLAY